METPLQFLSARVAGEQSELVALEPAELVGASPWLAAQRTAFYHLGLGDGLYFAIATARIVAEDAIEQVIDREAIERTATVFGIARLEKSTDMLSMARPSGLGQVLRVWHSPEAYRSSPAELRNRYMANGSDVRPATVAA